MNGDENRNAPKELADDELDAVAGGFNISTKQMTAVCSVCGAVVTVEAIRLPTFGRCPSCGKDAYFNAIGYKFL